MHDRTGNLLYTQYPVWTQKSGGGVTGVKVESTDGTVDVQKTTAGGVTIYDLSTQVTEEASRWGGIVMRGTGVEGDGMWHPVQVDSTQGPAPYATGWTVEKDCVADIAAALEFSCDNHDALNTIDVQCEFVVNGTVERTEGSMLDPTQSKGRISFEYKGAVAEGDKIDCRIYVRCNQDVTLFLSGYAVYNEEVDGVVGGGSGGNTVRVSTDETVLSTTSYNMSSNPTITLSEPVWNFEYVDVYALPHSTNTIPVVIRFSTTGLVSNNKGSITVQAHADGGGIRLNNALVTITSAGNIQITESGQFSIIGTTVSSGTAASVFTKVVGVSRIASA
jgi:hypothetical protein